MSKTVRLRSKDPNRELTIVHYGEGSNFVILKQANLVQKELSAIFRLLENMRGLSISMS